MYKVNRFYRKKKIGPVVIGDEKFYLKYMIPYGRIINDPAIVINKDGSIQTTLSYRGPDLNSSIKEQLGIMTAQLNGTFETLTTGCALYFESQRVPSTAYPTDTYFPDELTRRIDNERKKWFQKGEHYESNYFFTFYWLPPSDNEAKMKDFFLEGTTQTAFSLDMHIETFMNMINKLYRAFKDVGIPVRFMNQDEMTTYLHSTVSGSNQKIHLPNRPILLDSLIYDSPFACGSDPIIGKKHVRVVVPVKYTSMSTFGMFDELNRLPFSYRWVTRFYCLSKKDSLKELESYRKGWYGKVESWGSMLKDIFMGPGHRKKVDNNALLKVDEVTEAKLLTERDEFNYGYYSTMIVVMDEDEEAAQKKAEIIEDLFLNKLGTNAQIEHINAGDSWFASVPGNVNHQVRRPMLSTGNLIHTMPFSSVWAGEDRCPHKQINGPALLYTQTEGNAPYRLNLHVDDVAHTLILGMTGSGKSVLLNTINAQFRKYKDAQIFIFDKGASSRILTEGVGGTFYDLGNASDEISFQPLLHADDDKEREWLSGWLCDYLAREKVEVTPKIKGAVWDALDKMKTTVPSDRTMLTFCSYLQDTELKTAFESLTAKGPHGRIFDSSKEVMNFSSWTVFEMTKLMESAQQHSNVIGTTLLYIFHRIKQQLTGRPTIIDLDECWVFFDDPLFSNEIRQWLKELRKYNAAVIFATQSLIDVKDSNIFNTVLESCLSQIFLPFDKAMTDEYRPIYKAFGLNDRQIEIIAKAKPKRQYYYSSPEGSRLFDLGLSPLELAYFGVTKEDLIECQSIIDRFGREQFVDKWEQYKKLKGA
jgi:Type IV secretory pathway, VirB4 components